MAKVLNMFREFSMEHIDGYDRLSNYEKKRFDTTYKKHLSSIPLENRINYSENSIRKIEVIKIDSDIPTLKVYFKHEVYIYLPGNKWIKTTK
mgnify:FL=1